MKRTASLREVVAIIFRGGVIATVRVLVFLLLPLLVGAFVVTPDPLALMLPPSVLMFGRDILFVVLPFLVIACDNSCITVRTPH